MVTTKIDQSGRLLIPKKIRERLGLHPGTPLEVVEDNGEVRIRSAEPGARLVREGNVLVIRGVKTKSDAEQIVQQDRQRWIRRQVTTTINRMMRRRAARPKVKRAELIQSLHAGHHTGRTGR
ncbi:MAG: AbrB/MazE/SpoVT family DNA-binding domain-containing protein [Phycisphaeraceae bacterium]